MTKFYILKSGYIPDNASTIRFMGMLKAFSDKGIDAEVIFFMSDKNNSEAPQLPHISYHYYWKNFNVKNEKLKILLYLIVFSRLFYSKLKAGDTVYLYGCNEMISRLVNIEGIRVFHERTEHPLVSKLKLLNVRKYLNACTKLDGLFVISSALKEYFESIGVSADKVHIINMTVDASRFESLVKKPSERYIAYCGKATNNKDGVDQLIKSFAITLKTHADVELYIIGTPPRKADESGNLELVESLGITDKVVFTGVIPSEQIPQVLKNAEILALNRPDNMQAKYGFPTKLGEYLLTGNPVVITRVGDIPLFLKDGENALIASPNEPVTFAEKVNWLLDNQQEAIIIGANGVGVAKRNFDSMIEAQKMIRIMFNKYF